MAIIGFYVEYFLIGFKPVMQLKCLNKSNFISDMVVAMLQKEVTSSVDRWFAVNQPSGTTEATCERIDKKGSICVTCGCFLLFPHVVRNASSLFLCYMLVHDAEDQPFIKDTNSNK